MKKERVVNIRFLFCVFMGLIFGMLANFLFLIKSINLIVLIFTVLICIMIAMLCWIYADKTKSHNLKYKARKNVSFLLKCSGLGFACAFIVGIILIISPVNQLLQIKNYESEVVVSGVVCDYVDEESTYTKFVIKDCGVVGSNFSEETNFKILVYSSTFANVSLGDKVVFNATLNTFNYKDDMSKMSQGIGYSTYVNFDDLLVESGDMTLKDIIREKVRDTFADNLNEDNANISYAIMFGDKHGMSDNISEMFSYAGISHILAVSGLHVGVLVSLIWFCLNKLKINKYIKLVVLSVVLIFYAYLCDFSPSVCRAAIMAMTLALCKTIMIEYDMLSSLSIAGLTILLISPMSLFSVSFQLSFLCIFAIISLAPSLTRFFAKIRIPKVLATSLGVSVAVNVVILPICMNTFTTVSILGVLANIFILPIFSVLFILLFVLSVISALLSPVGVLLKIPEMFLHIIKMCAYYVSSIPFGVFKVFKIGYIVLFVISLCALTIHFWMRRTWVKGVIVGVLFVGIIVSFIINLIPQKYDGNMLIINRQYNSNVILYIEDGEVTLIGSDITLNTLNFIMKDIEINEIDNIIAYDLSLNSLCQLNSIIDEFDVDAVYIPRQYNYEQVISGVSNSKSFNDSMELGNLGITTLLMTDDIIGVKVETSKTTLVIPVQDIKYYERNYLQKTYCDVEYVLVDNMEYWEGLSKVLKLIDLKEIDKIIL